MISTAHTTGGGESTAQAAHTDASKRASQQAGAEAGERRQGTTAVEQAGEQTAAALPPRAMTSLPPISLPPSSLPPPQPLLSFNGPLAPASHLWCRPPPFGSPAQTREGARPTSQAASPAPAATWCGAAPGQEPPGAAAAPAWPAPCCSCPAWAGPPAGRRAAALLDRPLHLSPQPGSAHATVQAGGQLRWGRLRVDSAGTHSKLSLTRLPSAKRWHERHSHLQKAKTGKHSQRQAQQLLAPLPRTRVSAVRLQSEARPSASAWK